MPRTRVLAAGTAAGGVMGLAALAGRYAAGISRASRAWAVQIESALRDFGEVDEVSILPLVERLTPDRSGLFGEAGVSCLVRAGGMRVLFDSGLSGGKPDSALAHNARLLGVQLDDLDAVVISQAPVVHVCHPRLVRPYRSLLPSMIRETGLMRCAAGEPPARAGG